MQAGADAAAALTQVKLAASRFPGDHELAIRIMRGDESVRSLRLGPLWMYDGSSACLSALAEFGEPAIVSG